LIYEVLHAVETDFKLKCFEGEEGHTNLDRIAHVLADTLIRNGMINEKVIAD